ncbi:MAG: hypothetical protein KJZ65_12960 [Phycisphaerales bacterium]|nr:hypothetical protein [Phycisphaerales bacterium]
MTRIVALTSVALLVGVVGGIQQSKQTQPGSVPPGHPAIGAEPPPAEPSPPAKPEDVASIDAIIGAYYAASSAAAGEPRQWERLHSLFKPDARMIACRPIDRKADVWLLPIGDYIAFNAAYMQSGGYFEKEVARRVESFGHIAQVWSTYEARKLADSPEPYSRGIYSFQLLHDGDRWWIINAYWDYERPESPIPEKYLQTP